MATKRPKRKVVVYEAQGGFRWRIERGRAVEAESTQSHERYDEADKEARAHLRRG